MCCFGFFSQKHKKYKFIIQSVIAGLSVVGGIALLALGLTVPLGSALVASGVALIVPFSFSPFNKKENEDMKDDIKELQEEMKEMKDE